MDRTDTDCEAGQEIIYGVPRFVAAHEAAHAVVALALGFRVESATILSTSPERAGHVTVIDDLDGNRLERAKRRLLLAWSGPIGEFYAARPELLDPKQSGRVNVQFDRRISQADFELSRVACDFIAKRCRENPATIQRRGVQHVASLLRMLLWPCVSAVAAELLTHKTLTGERVVEICAAHRPAAFQLPRRIEIELVDDMKEIKIKWGRLDA
jgi:hypothetical protein